MVVGKEHHIAATTAVSAVRTTRRNIFFPMKRDRTVSPASGLNADFYDIYKQV